MDPKTLIYLAITLAIFIGLISLFGILGDWLSNELSGPEYCFSDVETVQLTLASEAAKVTITQSTGDQLCFRTKDYTIVERINQQIQDRKLQEELARIEANKEFWDRNFIPFVLILLFAFIIVVILLFYLWE